MKKIIKQTVGIDVAKDELVVCLAKMFDDFSHDTALVKSFPNNKTGVASMVQWAQKKSLKELPLYFVCEATGVYHEAMVYYLADKKCLISIVLPNKISSFMKSLDIKTITDQTASKAIAEFGFRQLEIWKKPNEAYKKLKHLTRERDQIVVERTMLKNQLHAEKAQAEPYKASVERFQSRIKMLNKHDKEVLLELHQIIKSNSELETKVSLITSVPGIGELTACIILAETDGFSLIRNKKQLSSYAGLDVKEKISGISVKGRATISKRGNKFLRKCLHMAALSAIKHEPQFKITFARLVAKHGIKMKAGVAIHRKLLELSYTLCKKNEKYISPKIEIPKPDEVLIAEKKLVSELN